jgi:aminoglycoside phosphotransferase (APT) family kinase protein
LEEVWERRACSLATLEHLAQRIEPQSRLLRAWPLTGGISAQMTALEMEQPGGRVERLIVRQPGEATLKRNPSAATDEYRLLRVLSAGGLPVPVPRYLDESGELFTAPYLVLEFIAGETALAPSCREDFIAQMAAPLAAIHRLGDVHQELSFLPEQSRKIARTLTARPPVLDVSLDEGRIREALEPVWPLPQSSEPVLLHGDFWPGNLIWRDGRIAAVIDWEDAAIGDRLYDVATSRLDILWVFGADAMHDFTARYQAMTSTDFANLPYWDLIAALRPVSQIAEWGDVYPALGRMDITEESMRDGHARFVAQAFARLSAP